MITPTQVVKQPNGDVLVKVGKPEVLSWMTPKALAEQLGMSHKTVLGWIGEGKIPAEFISNQGFRRRQIRADALAWLQAKFAEAHGEAAAPELPVKGLQQPFDGHGRPSQLRSTSGH